MKETSDSSSVSPLSSLSEEDFQGYRSPAKSQQKRRASKNTMTLASTTMWDRENLSCRQAAAFFVAAASPLRHLCQRHPPLTPRSIVGGEITEKLKQSALKKNSSVIRLHLFSTGIMNLFKVLPHLGSQRRGELLCLLGPTSRRFLEYLSPLMGPGEKQQLQSIAYWYPIRLLTRSSFSPLTRLRPAVT